MLPKRLRLTLRPSEMDPKVETPIVPLEADERGAMRSVGTRVRLDTGLLAWNQGLTPEPFVGSFDVLDLAGV